MMSRARTRPSRPSSPMSWISTPGLPAGVALLLLAACAPGAAQVAYAVGTYPQSVTTADVDGDGAVDLVAANLGSNTLSVLRNKGDG